MFGYLAIVFVIIMLSYEEILSAPATCINDSSDCYTTLNVVLPSEAPLSRPRRSAAHQYPANRRARVTSRGQSNIQLIKLQQPKSGGSDLTVPEPIGNSINFARNNEKFVSSNNHNASPSPARRNNFAIQNPYSNGGAVRSKEQSKFFGPNNTPLIGGPPEVLTVYSRLRHRYDTGQRHPGLLLKNNRVSKSDPTYQSTMAPQKIASVTTRNIIVTTSPVRLNKNSLLGNLVIQSTHRQTPYRFFYSDPNKKGQEHHTLYSNNPTLTINTKSPIASSVRRPFAVTEYPNTRPIELTTTALLTLTNHFTRPSLITKKQAIVSTKLPALSVRPANTLGSNLMSTRTNSTKPLQSSSYNQWVGPPSEISPVSANDAVLSYSGFIGPVDKDENSNALQTFFQKEPLVPLTDSSGISPPPLANSNFFYKTTDTNNYNNNNNKNDNFVGYMPKPIVGSEFQPQMNVIQNSVPIVAPLASEYAKELVSQQNHFFANIYETSRSIESENRDKPTALTTSTPKTSQVFNYKLKMLKSPVVTFDDGPNREVVDTNLAREYFTNNNRGVPQPGLFYKPPQELDLPASFNYPPYRSALSTTQATIPDQIFPTPDHGQIFTRPFGSYDKSPQSPPPMKELNMLAINKILQEILSQSSFNPYLNMQRETDIKGYFPFKYFNREKLVYIAELSRLLLKTTKYLVNTFKPNNAIQFIRKLSEIDINKSLRRICPIPHIKFSCRPEKYRSFNGFCNNPLFPTRGSAYLPLKRLLTPQYRDFVGTVKSGGNIPYPDAIAASPLLQHSVIAPSPKLTALTFYYLHFVLDDILILPFHEECAFQSFYTKSTNAPVRKLCAQKLRSFSGISLGCKLGMREQINLASSYLDASMIYGTTEDRSNFLRTFENGHSLMLCSAKNAKLDKEYKLLGKLKTPPYNTFQNLAKLPFIPSNFTTRCDVERFATGCLYSGSQKVQENAILSFLHAAFVTYHNYLCDQLLQVNYYWDDETLFQEARKIIGALVQHITFDELLPLLLDPASLNLNDLQNNPNGYYEEYDLEIDPTSLNVIAVTLVPLTYIWGLNVLNIPNITRYYKPDIIFNLPEKKFSPANQLNQSLNLGPEEISLANAFPFFDQQRPGIIADSFLPINLTTDFALPSNMITTLKSDLISYYIYKSRDHGTPDYMSWRRFCKLYPFDGQTASTQGDTTDSRNNLNYQPSKIHFNQLAVIFDWKAEHERPKLGWLKALYKGPEDIDLLVGILLEMEVLNYSQLGPTASCIVSNQFMRLKRGDRFWYETNVEPNKFSTDQIVEIKKVKLAKILCETTETYKRIQPDAFLIADKSWNFPVSCDILPNINISKWREPSEFNNLQKYTDRKLDEKKILYFTQLGANNAHNEDLIEFDSYQNSKSNSKNEIEYFSDTRPESIALAQLAHILINTTGIMVEKFNLQSQDLELIKIIPVPKFLIFPQLDECGVPQTIECDRVSKYRRIDGRCNNLQHSEYGASMTELRRFLPPKYEDRVNIPRFRGLDGKTTLPNPNNISWHVFKFFPYIISSNLTLAFLTWAQFLDHDMALIPISRGYLNSRLNCEQCHSPYTVSRNCMPVNKYMPISFTPHHGYNFDVPCQSFVRSSAANTKFGPREQLNENTAYIDGSMIYGSNLCTAKKLRTFNGGKLKLDKESPDLSTLASYQCGTSAKDCLNPVGDPRANSNRRISAVYSLFTREHNRIAGELNKFNPQWRDEKIFQETRKIIGAMIQHITYNEFLPKLLGLANMHKFGLELNNKWERDYWNSYDACDAGIRNSFITSAFNFFNLIFIAANNNSIEWSNLDERAKNPNAKLLQFLSRSEDRSTELDIMAKILISSTINDVNFEYLDRETLNKIKTVTHEPVDPISLALLRGRDHGLPSYADYLRLCNISLDLADLQQLSRDDRFTNLIALLFNLYGNIDDIDLFVGGLAENPYMGSLVGPTFACLIGYQFQYLRRCDRYWYENGASNTRFTLDQLNEIRQITFAKIICNNVKFRTVQPNVMMPEDELRNRPENCDSLPGVDLNKWSESDTCFEQGMTIEKGAYHLMSPCHLCYCPFNENKARCTSVRIENCFQLFTLHTKAEIIEDESCMIQCSHLLAQQQATSGELLEDANFYIGGQTNPFGGSGKNESNSAFGFYDMPFDSRPQLSNNVYQSDIILPGKYGLNITRINLPNYFD